MCVCHVVSSRALKDECTYVSTHNSEIISISKHSLSLFFFFHHFEIVEYCLGFLTNQIFVDQKMFSMFQHFKYSTRQ